MKLKLYKVTCKGMTTDCMGTQTAHGIAYVVASDADTAYMKLRDSLDARNLGFPKDREMDKVELIAAVGDYPACGVALYV